MATTFGQGFTAYSAQPKQQQSQGTPYNPQQGGNFSAWNPQNFQQVMRPGGGEYTTGLSQQQQQQQMTAWAQPKQQLLEWGTQAPRPNPVQAMPAMNQFGPMPNQNLNNIMQQRQALVQQINNSQANQQVGTWLGQGAPPDNWGQQQFNPQQMWRNASQMVGQGWQNPFAPPQAAVPGPGGGPSGFPDQWIGGSPNFDFGQGRGPDLPVRQPPQPDLRSGLTDLFGRSGMQIQPGVMDQILKLLTPQAPQQQYQPPGRISPPSPRLPELRIGPWGGEKAQGGPAVEYLKRDYELPGWQQYQPPRQPSPPGQQPSGGRAPGYGDYINMPPGHQGIAIWEDSDGDGIDDKYQPGPGMPHWKSQQPTTLGEDSYPPERPPSAARPIQTPSQGQPYRPDAQTGPGLRLPMPGVTPAPNFSAVGPDARGFLVEYFGGRQMTATRRAEAERRADEAIAGYGKHFDPKGNALFNIADLIRQKPDIAKKYRMGDYAAAEDSMRQLAGVMKESGAQPALPQYPPPFQPQPEMPSFMPPGYPVMPGERYLF